jgi:hypothetical protein
MSNATCQPDVEVLPPVEAMITCPFEDEVTVTFDPATMYEDPSVSCVNDPDIPKLNDVAPLNVDPEIVATIESSIANEAVEEESVNTKPEEPETERRWAFGRLAVLVRTR